MKYRKHQFKEMVLPEDNTALDPDCLFCGKDIRNGDRYFVTTEGHGVDIICICQRCYETEITT